MNVPNSDQIKRCINVTVSLQGAAGLGGGNCDRGSTVIHSLCRIFVHFIYETFLKAIHMTRHKHGD